MIISALSNDVSQKREFWQQFSNKHQCDFKYKQTPHKEVNMLNMSCLCKDIIVYFNESDAKPLICEFKINTNKNITIEIIQITLFDRLWFIFKKKHNVYNNSFFKKKKIKSNDTKLLNRLLKDNDLLNLLANSEVFSLYGYTKNNFLNVRITSTYFVNNYEKLNNIYSIICKIIIHLKK